MNESRATRYQRLRRRARAVGLSSGALMIGVLAVTPAGRGLATWTEGLVGGWPPAVRPVLSLAAFSAASIALWELAMLPAAWLVGRRIETAYGGQRVGVLDTVGAQARAALLTFVAALLAGIAIRLGDWVAGPWWWAVTGAGLAVALFGALHGAPGVIARAAGARPVERPALVERLGVLARRVRVPIASIDQVPARASPTATALVTGAGRSRRVFIASDVLRDWTDEEIAVVVAHEMAHQVHHDLWLTILSDAALLSAGLWASDRALAAWGATLGLGGPSDMAALPLVAGVAGIVWLAATPARHALSRRQERRADQFALALTGSADAFIAAIRRLGARHLAEERPSRWTRWFYLRHPSVAERLAMAEAFRRVR